MINERRDQLSLDDANTLAGVVTDYFRRPAAIREALVLEGRHLDEVIKDAMELMLKDIDKGDSGDVGDAAT